MKSKNRISCEECGYPSDTLNEVDSLLYCEDCTRIMVRAASVESEDGVVIDMPQKFDF